MNSKRLILIALSLTLTLGLILLAIEFASLSREVVKRFEKNKFQPPIDFYASSFQLSDGQTLSAERLEKELLRRRYRQRSENQTLQKRDFQRKPPEMCPRIKHVEREETRFLFLVQPEQSSETLGQSCLQFRPQSDDIGIQIRSVVWDDTGAIHLFENELPYHGTWPLEPELFAQFYGDSPILRTEVSLGEVPMACLDTVQAIEDSEFLDHQGFSAKAIARAFLANLRSGRVSQGGSTITQQLVKNYFLTPEKTLRRKVRELILSVLLEWHFSKEEILETYLNTIYMGQNGSYQIRGYGAASEHYFGKRLRNLNLAECALLAAIVNSPGRYDPARHPEAAEERRQKVLDRALELKLITSEQRQEAAAYPLPTDQGRRQQEPAPYFVQTVIAQLKKLKLPLESGLKVYTTIDFRYQSEAAKAVREGLESLNKRVTKEEQEPLQGSILTVHIPSGAVLALRGGENYVSSQFNRVLDAQRLVGSTAKPFVYLAALESGILDTVGNPFSPWSTLKDEPLTWKYEGQTWQPENYSRTYRGDVTAIEALALSLNVPTVQLGQLVGSENLEKVFQSSGLLPSTTAFLPSHILGSMQVSPWNLAQSYLPIARQGQQTEIHTFTRVENLEGETLWSLDPTPVQIFDPENALVLVSMLEQVFKWGTASRVAQAYGFHDAAAGKTGTTNDGRDSWFVGFTPEILTVVWVGRDDNTPTSLTGASGALPIWLNYTLKIPRQEKQFSWPEHFHAVSRALHSEKAQDINSNPLEVQLNLPEERWGP